ncbi:Bax inhibitor-1/YccA family protein [Bacillus sp. Marseille-P3800]|uniref:Bax inhibitor-1/YccA family protein n=1 Tax=Bacillus sp. Marseille-P3800 TaxID=2014782 RepID=UPI000C06B43B|nr:Bax inhibitor-1 family protein [Bacillus sp. Marseille-P3800]
MESHLKQNRGVIVILSRRNRKLNKSIDPALLNELLLKLILTLVVTFVGAFIGIVYLTPTWAMVCGIAALILMVVYMIAKFFTGDSSSVYGPRMSMWFVYLLAFLLGLSLSSILALYISTAGASIIVLAMLITIIMFSGLAIYSYKSNKDFGFLGGILFFALFALIGVSIFGVFFSSDLLSLGIGWAGIVIFSGYILMEISDIKEKGFEKEDVPAAVLSLYLSFINLFLHILRVLTYFTKNN